MKKTVFLLSASFLLGHPTSGLSGCLDGAKKVAGWFLGTKNGTEQLDREKLLALIKENHRTELFAGEKWFGGSRDAEIKHVLDTAVKVFEAQKKFRRNDGSVGKAQHRGGLGGWISQVEILDVPPELRHDWLAEPKGTHLIGITNFTTGMGNKKLPWPLRPFGYIWYGSSDVPNAFPDVLGGAVKFWKPGTTVVNDSANGTNSKSAFAETPPRFADFMGVQSASPLTILPKALWWAVKNPKGVARLVESTALRARASALTQVYGSGHAYSYGDTPARLSIEIDPDSPIAKEGRGFKGWLSGIFNGLRDGKHLVTNLREKSQETDVDLIIYAHIPDEDISPDERTRLIESGLVQWKSKKIKFKKVPVARVRLLKNGLTPESTEIANQLTWNAGNTFGDSIPLGAFGRFREAVYKASQLGRAEGVDREFANFVNGSAHIPQLKRIEELHADLVPTAEERAAAARFKFPTETSYFRAPLVDARYDGYFEGRSPRSSTHILLNNEDTATVPASYLQSALKHLKALDAELKAHGTLSHSNRQSKRKNAEAGISRDIALLQAVLRDRKIAEEPFNSKEYFRSNISSERYAGYFASPLVPNQKFDTVILSTNLRDATEIDLRLALKEVRSLYAEFLASDYYKLHGQRRAKRSAEELMPKDIAAIEGELHRRGLWEDL